MTHDGLDVEVLKPHIGAKVHLDRSMIGDPDKSRELLALLEKHSVLVFPGIDLSDAEQLALTDSLGGRVNISAAVVGRETSPEVYKVSLDKDAGIEPEFVRGTFFWHMDGLTVDVPPPKATVLSARKLSPSGGQTEFASTEAALAALPAAEQEELEQVRVLHTVTASLREFMSAEELDETRKRLQHEHPLVWKRLNGKKSMLIGYTADKVIGRDQAEGRALLMRLLEWTVQPDFSYRHEWQKGDCVVWDNTRTLHRVQPYSQDSGRMMHRTVIAGVETAD